MNLCELVKVMEDGQVAFSKECDERIFYSGAIFRHKESGKEVVCDFNYLLAEDWEIEVEWVDFWTAWKAARDEGLAIRSEHSWNPVVFQNIVAVNKEMINGRWIILR
ncbi:hypothetical protein [Paenibacillus cremeus]|uniref:Uncharacterized protein n=1 Tax=Paenibacillus cremeus TaxID=2163881 RepID=A0A559KCH1_9BACL|nr:hypothetical protein [Paenibacillus cremeus]TVY09832.1 hypothetical protein FPZ49_10680 [Paenibacillus cremeus]